jgi:hypothetical protein
VLLYQLFIVAAVSALFMPFFGPMLDHHFAERQPSHGHIFFGPADAEHVHFYEAAHTHFHAHDLPAIPAGNGSESNKLPNEVVYLTSPDGVGQSSPSFTVTSLYIDLVFPDQGDSRFLLSLAGQDDLPSEIFIPPPERPPRA